MRTWDHRADLGPQIVHLFGPFGIDPRLGTLDADFPERLLKALARKHRLYLYDVPSLEGSDAYGFILSRERSSASARYSRSRPTTGARTSTTSTLRSEAHMG